MIKNFLTVGGWTMVSRILGLIRDQLLAAFLGAGAAQDALQIALRLPNMFRRLFGEGAFNAAFVPIFTTRLEKGGPTEAQSFGREALGGLLFWLITIACLGEVFMPWVIDVIAPGFPSHGHRFDLAVSLTRITFPYLILICAAALVAGVLNALGKFTMAAAAYASFNVVGIVAILIGGLVFHDAAHASAWGLTISGVLQLALLAWAAKRAEMSLHPTLPRLTAEMMALLRRLGFGLIGSGVTQINLMIDTMIATLLPAGSIGWLYFADRINQLPLGVLGAAAGTTLLPTLTRHAARGDVKEGQTTLNNAIDYTAILTLPACCGLIALAPQIMAGLFGYGHFTTQDALASAQSLAAYAIGLPAFVLVKVLSPGFYAHGDTRTPVIIGFGTLALNLALNLLLYKPLAHIGPPLASAMAAIINVAALAIILHRRRIFRPTRLLVSRLARMLAASVIMGVVAWDLARDLAPGMITFPGVQRLVALTILIGGAGILYLTLLGALGIGAPRTLIARLVRRRRQPLP